jgi:quercetin dioxygenase-like cupin family protein
VQLSHRPARDGGGGCKVAAMPVSRDSDVQAHERFGNFMQGLATPSRGAHEVMVWRTRVAPGGGPPVHTHDHEEVVVIVSGTGTFVEEDGTVHHFGPGDTLFAPAETVHELKADEGVAVEWIACMPTGTKTFRPDGEELPTPWSE